jgi:glycosyltransferase involved in cell wall biosynthesis
VHRAFDNRIYHKECATLAEAGYDVTLIAANAEGAIADRNGVRLVELKPPRNRFERFFRAIPQLYRAALMEDADIYHFHDPELMPIGVLLRLHGKKVIYDVHEDYSGSMGSRKWIPAPLRGVAAWGVRGCERLFADCYSKIVAATPTIAGLFPSSKVTLVQNFPWIRELHSEDAVSYADREAIVAHVGALSMDRGLAEMAKAAELVAATRPVKLVLAGKVFPSGCPGLEPERWHGVIEYSGLLSRPRVAELLARSRVGIVTLHPTRNYINSQPTKLYEYMSAGIPVVASDFPVWRQVVEPSGCGLLVDPLDPAAIAAAIHWLLAHPAEAEEMGRNGRRAVNERYNWEREGANLVAAYAELAGSREASLAERRSRSTEIA